MAFDAYLYIDGIKGESTDSEHKDWIEVLSYSHPIAQPAASSSSAGGSAGPVVRQSLSIVKKLDISTPKLYVAASSGKHIPKVTIDLMRASGGAPVKYLTVKMEEVFITSVSPAGRTLPTSSPTPTPGNLTRAMATTSSLMTESVSFNYGSIQWVYTQQKR